MAIITNKTSDCDGSILVLSAQELNDYHPDFITLNGIRYVAQNEKVWEAKVSMLYYLKRILTFGIYK